MTESAQLTKNQQWKDPEWQRGMRADNPVWQDPETKLWHVFRYAEVSAALSDYQTYSSNFSAVIPDRKELAEGNILQMDPPRHHRLRSLASRAFTPKAIAQLEGRIADITNQMLDTVADQDKWELVDVLAYPLPVIVIAELLGVPAQDRPLFKVWADAMLNRERSSDFASKESLDRSAKDLGRFHDYLREHVAACRKDPREDLLSALVAAEIDGERLSDQEIVGFATILLLAGHITTTALLGNCLLTFDEHPEVWEQLRTDPGKLGTATEEVLRYRSPFGQTARVTTTEVELSGKTVAANSFVTFWLGSANRDEREFEAPDEFRIDRKHNPHVGFGRGVHFCIGAPLARLEAKVALGIMLDRYKQVRVDRDQPLDLQQDPGFNGVKSLHLVTSPR
jgi:cytochrome P450